MSKKMWHKIFKSKSQKQQQPLSKINKRHSRGIYEEYQQLNELLNGEKSQAARFASENENENVNENGKANGNGSNCCSSSGNINVFEQQPLQSSFNSLALSEAQQQQQQSHHQQQQQQSQQLSTFSRVRNTFSLRRNSSNNNNSSSSNKKQTPNAKSSESATPTRTPTAAGAGQLQHVLIIVNQIDVAAAATVAPTTTTTTTNTATNLHANQTTTTTTMDSDGNLDDEPVGPKPGPLTTGFSEILQEQEVVCSTQLLACPNCSRTFNTNALRKHVVVCEKMLKKRKVFDSSRQRREGTSLSTYVLPKNFGLPNAEKAPGVHTPPTASREASTVSSSGVPHEASPLSIRRKSKTDMTRASLRKGAGAGTAATVGVAAAGPANAEPQATSAAAATAPPTLSRDRSRASDRSITRRIKDTATEHCPHCERNFNIKAFDRHVEWCKEKAIQANIKSNNTAETNKAKERMEARKKYRPPNLKTKRSINRDKYSGAQEEHFEPEPVAVKQNLMTLSTMTSSVQSDNSQRNAPQQRPGTPQVFDASKSKASLGQSKAGARMLTEELSSVVYQERVRRRQQYDACQEIDEAVERLRHPSYEQLAQLDCVEAAHLQPARSHRRPSPHRSKFDSTECMAGQPQVTMTFEELNGLIKCKDICLMKNTFNTHAAPPPPPPHAGATNICNIQMDIEDHVAPKVRTSTSLVRQARRRIRTQENPNIPLRQLEPPTEFVDEHQHQQQQHQRQRPSHSPAAFRRIANDRYSGSESEDALPHAEIQIKMETSTMRSLSRPRKRIQLPVIINSSEPMRALPLPLPPAKQKPEAKGDSFLPAIDMKGEVQAQMDSDGEAEQDYDEEDIEVGQLLSKAKLLEGQYNDDIDDSVYGEVEPPAAPASLKKRATPSNVSRRLVVLEQDEEGTMYIKAPRSPTNSKKSARAPIKSGLNPSASDKYDPFLSAKRQLEELCSPSTPPDNEPLVRTTATPTVTPTATPTAIMSTSLTSSLGKATSTTSTTASKGTPTSNFRRTSSLRGPRRTPLLPSRPLFATNYRPTIQRGLSDEGPISSNFLKPEEYDEMPVRAACGNDFHSPRVVRRDTSNSNRKQQMKLPLGGDTEPDNTSTSTSKQQQQQAPPARNVAKTDSLAVFLKYEHELEQLNAKAAEVAANSKELSSKDLKDKSNNLSKQNSAKNLNANSSSGQLPPLTTPICPPVAKENNENVAHNFATPLRLDPIVKPQQSLINNSNNNNSNGGGIAAPSPIKLESIFGSNRMADYIDPKLINPCDNLLVQQSSTGSSDASSTPQQLSQSRSSSQSTITMGQEQRRHSGEARNLLKRKMRLGRNQFLYDASPEEAYISSGSCADDEANRSSLEFDEQCWQQQQKQLLSNPLKAMPLTLPNMPVLPTFDDFDFEEFLSSFENENDDEQFPLFRDCREFLLNRTTSRHRSFQKATSTPQPQPQPQSQPQSHTQTQPPTPTATQRPATTSGIGSQYITPPKTHYFASSTKEPHAHRSNSNTSIGNESFKSPQASTGSYKTPNGSGSYKTSPTSAFKSPLSSSDEKLDRQLSNVSGTSSSSNCYVEKTQKSVDESKKREIFISIETEANAQGRSPISPDSLRHMVGNAQTPIDVLHIENGNEPEHAKFSKISDNEDPIDDETSRAHYPNRLSPAVTSPLPNVEANNAKNVIEKMRNDFKQLGEEASASVRRDILQRQEQAQQKQQMPTQQEVKGMTPSPSGDSDELSSLDGYPMSSSQSSRRGGSSKLSTDSAYGSSNSPYCLSRQRSTELQSNMSTPRTPSQLRPHTASGAIAMSTKQPSNMMDASTQAQSNYGTLKARQRMFAPNGLGICSDAGNGNMEYSSSSSEQLMQQQQEQHQQHHKQNTNYNYIQQQQQSQPQVANNNSNSYELNALNLKNNNCNSVGVGLTPTTSQHSLQSNNSNASVKMSKFCHECGAKFVLEHAKFCMECGVRRVVL
ncbi:hypothetical protein AWZ03_010514 [Drosophila navojoa]|uniref:C2HC/C3H-type domain-containing protein n=1 Tax=Drosophila navojoa TaxID=7232 RepID=A0A484B4P1_DRONA|nr:hypothetical protein AWZ03_010514 [Drosophila navojoa]